eukprot:TRINITY_DN7258_c0_g1_i1.p1 TRINITY_DN7258_c0_g1~~TRINITY_DN7258_c0_g1_i1.p1  ORF type:complete len:1434 (-),score=569.04 TRINITY_DN7258_c0_g1_i1:98-4399(-)
MRIPSNLLLNVAFPILRHLNLHLHVDIVLFCKMTRIFRELLRQEDTDAAVREEVEKLIVKAILPGLSMIGSNPGVTFEVWDMLKLLPYQKRYEMYYQWKNVAYTKVAELIGCKAAALFESKKMLRRISTETIKQQGRNIGKISHSNAPVLFEEALTQVSIMESLIQVMVDGLKYCTPLSLDVLSYSLLEKVASHAEDKLKKDGTSISMWFQNVAVFAGAFYRKHHNVEFSGLLHYIVNQLKDEQSIDLILLRELIAAMTGIEIIEHMGSGQLEAQAGGETLRIEASIGQQRTSLRKPSNRLRDALTSTKLMIPLLVLIAQQRAIIIYNSESRQLKLIGDLYDKCQETFLQYVEFLTSHVSSPVFAAQLPSVLDLCKKYYLDHECALHASRYVLPQQYDDIMVLQSKKLARSVPSVVSIVPTTPAAPATTNPAAPAPASVAAAPAAPAAAAKSAASDAAVASLAPVTSPAAADAPAPMDVDSASTPASDAAVVPAVASVADPAAAPAVADAAAAVATTPVEVDKPAPAKDKPEAGSETVTRTASLALLLEQNTDPARSLLATARQLVPQSAWTSLSPQLWVTFWSLSLYDIVVPVQSYRDEIRRLEAGIFRLDDPSNPDNYDSDKRKKEKTRLTAVIEKLKAEQLKQEENHQDVMQRIQSEKSVWLDSRTSIIPISFIQYCVLPRVLLSLPDAVFCARFALMLHRLRTPHFCSYNYFDTVIRSAVQLLACCTDHEATRVAVFLQETLETLFAWRDLEVFNRECAPFPGFFTRGKPIPFTSFITAHYKWHNQSLARVMSTMLESNEYMTVRNALSTCTKLVKFFPATKKGHTFIVKRVKALINDERPDIKTLANMYYGVLQSRESKMQDEEDFKMESAATRPPPAKPLARPTVVAKPPVTPAVPSVPKSKEPAKPTPVVAKKPAVDAKDAKEPSTKETGKETPSKEAKPPVVAKPSTARDAKESDKDKAVSRVPTKDKEPADAAATVARPVSADGGKRPEKPVAVKKERSRSPPPLEDAELAERASKRRKAIEKVAEAAAPPVPTVTPPSKPERKDRERDERAVKTEERPAKQPKREDRPESREKSERSEPRDARDARTPDKSERDRQPRDKAESSEKKDTRKDDKRDESRRDDKKDEPKKDDKSKEGESGKDRKRDVKGKDVTPKDSRESKRRRTDEGLERSSPAAESPADTRDVRDKERSDREKESAGKPQQSRKEHDEAPRKDREEEKERRDDDKERKDKDADDRKSKHRSDKEVAVSRDKTADKREPEREPRPAEKDKRPDKEPEKERPKEKEPEPKESEKPKPAEADAAPTRRIIKFPKREPAPVVEPPPPVAPAKSSSSSSGRDSSSSSSRGSRDKDDGGRRDRDSGQSLRVSSDSSRRDSSSSSSSSKGDKQSDKSDRLDRSADRSSSDKSSESDSVKKRNYRTKSNR